MPNKEKKTSKIEFRIREADKESVENEADKIGMTVSGYLMYLHNEHKKRKK